MSTANYGFPEQTCGRVLGQHHVRSGGDAGPPAAGAGEMGPDALAFAPSPAHGRRREDGCHGREQRGMREHGRQARDRRRGCRRPPPHAAGPHPGTPLTCSCSEDSDRAPRAVQPCCDQMAAAILPVVASHTRPTENRTSWTACFGSVPGAAPAGAGCHRDGAARRPVGARCETAAAPVAGLKGGRDHGASNGGCCFGETGRHRTDESRRCRSAGTGTGIRTLHVITP